MFMFSWDFEADAWSRLWRWNLIKLCVWTCDMNSPSGPLWLWQCFYHQPILQVLEVLFASPFSRFPVIEKLLVDHNLVKRHHFEDKKLLFYLRLNKRCGSPLKAGVFFVGHSYYQPSKASQGRLEGASTYWLLDSGVWVRHRGRVRRRPSIRCFILAPLTSCTSVSPLVVRCSLICTVSHVPMETILLELRQYDLSMMCNTMFGCCFHKV